MSPGGWIHSVPVHFLPSGDGLRILAGASAVKTRNAAHTGHATLCVEVTDGLVRSFVTASGSVEILRPPPPGDLTALDLPRLVLAGALFSISRTTRRQIGGLTTDAGTRLSVAAISLAPTGRSS